MTAYASWNGATDVVRWRVLAGADEQHLHEVATVPRGGFETEILLGYLRDRYVAVQARGASGEPLGASLLQKRPAR